MLRLGNMFKASTTNDLIDNQYVLILSKPELKEKNDYTVKLLLQNGEIMETTLTHKELSVMGF